MARIWMALRPSIYRPALCGGGCAPWRGGEAMVLREYPFEFYITTRPVWEQRLRASVRI